MVDGRRNVREKLENKLNDFSGNYPSQNHSVGRMMTYLGFGKLVDLDLTSDEKKICGSMIKARKHDDLYTSAIPMFDKLLFGKYNLSLSPLDNEVYKGPKTEHELGLILADRDLEQYDLHSSTLDNIRKLQSEKGDFDNSNEINMHVLEDENMPFDILMAREKSDISLIAKHLNRIRMLFFPSRENLEKFKYLYNSVDEGFFREKSFEMLNESLTSGIDFDKYYTNSKLSESKESFMFLNLISALYLIDAAGIKYCASKERISEIDNYLQDNSHLFKMLDRSCKNYLKDQRKDMSVVYGFSGQTPGNYFELRAQPVADCLRGNFGELSSKRVIVPHQDYKKSNFELLLKDLDNSVEFRDIFGNLCSGCGVKEQYFLDSVRSNIE